ncbi:hypothetical protein BKA64DRAFT_721799 [Cadophora sp. MPI-SDFR-AT-0126]|nr:hypothetical protein BKA64DRAFT_721799 [Leotiomycetes sp. MPI-SDFR-AT-0126]
MNVVGLEWLVTLLWRTPHEAGKAQYAKVDTGWWDWKSGAKARKREPVNGACGVPKTSDVRALAGATTGAIHPEPNTSKTGAASANQLTSISSDEPTSSNNYSGLGAAASVSADPSSASQETKKQQGADRPSQTPGGEGSDRINETKKEAEDAAAAEESGSALKGGDGGEEDGPQKESHRSGTGEQYVKSTGVKAEGGDFDVGKPGAGLGADRLFEERGVHREQPGEGSPTGKEEASGAADSKSGKSSLAEKIKAKLHITKDKERLLGLGD